MAHPFGFTNNGNVCSVLWDYVLSSISIHIISIRKPGLWTSKLRVSSYQVVLHIARFLDLQSAACHSCILDMQFSMCQKLGQHNFEFRSVSTCRRLILFSYKHNEMSNHARRRSLHWGVKFKLWFDEMRGRSKIISIVKWEVWLQRSRSYQLHGSDNLLCNFSCP